MTTYLKEDFLKDAELVLEDSLDTDGAAAAIEASAAGSLLTVAQVIDVGDGLVEGYMIVDVDQIDIDEADELYNVQLQGTNVAAFATATLIIDLAQVNLGSGELVAAGTDEYDIGAAGDRFVVPFRNEQNGTVYRYLRVYQTIAGDGPSITDTIWLSIKRK